MADKSLGIFFCVEMFQTLITATHKNVVYFFTYFKLLETKCGRKVILGIL